MQVKRKKKIHDPIRRPSSGVSTSEQPLLLKKNMESSFGIRTWTHWRNTDRHTMTAADYVYHALIWSNVGAFHFSKESKARHLSQGNLEVEEIKLTKSNMNYSCVHRVLHLSTLGGAVVKLSLVKPLDSRRETSGVMQKRHYLLKERGPQHSPAGLQERLDTETVACGMRLTRLRDMPCSSLPGRPRMRTSRCSNIKHAACTAPTVQRTKWSHHL